MIRIGFLRSCFGCCSLRTGVLLCAIVDLIIGTSEIIEFCIRVYLDLHHNPRSTIHHRNATATNATIFHNSTTTIRTDKELYDDSAFAVIVVCIIDVLISATLLYVTAFRRYDLRVVVFIASIWCFVDAFLNIVQFAVFVALNLLLDMIEFLVSAILQILFGYVLLSYFKFMTQVVERGLDEVNMSYFPEGPPPVENEETDGTAGGTTVVVAGGYSDVVQMEQVVDEERTVMNDMEYDYNDDDEQKLVV